MAAYAAAPGRVFGSDDVEIMLTDEPELTILDFVSDIDHLLGDATALV